MAASGHDGDNTFGKTGKGKFRGFNRLSNGVKAVSPAGELANDGPSRVFLEQKGCQVHQACGRLVSIIRLLPVQQAF